MSDDQQLTKASSEADRSNFGSYRGKIFIRDQPLQVTRIGVEYLDTRINPFKFLSDKGIKYRSTLNPHESRILPNLPKAPGSWLLPHTIIATLEPEARYL